MRIQTAQYGAIALLVAFILFASGIARAEPNCTCRYKGQSYAIDTCVCLTTSEGPRMACCGYVLNNTSWNFTKRLCPTAEQSTPMPAQSFAAWQERKKDATRALIR